MDLTLLLDMAVEGFPDRVLVGGADLTAADVDGAARAGADVIRRSSSPFLLYLAPNGPEFPVALFAAARAGVPLVPLNYRLGEDQLADLLVNHRGALCIAPAERQAVLERAAVRHLTPAEWMTQAVAGAPEAGGQESGAGEGAAAIIYTSGTTSTPKGVVLRHEHLVSYVMNTVEFGSAAEEDACLISVPPYHIAAVANVISNFYAGRRCVVLSQFEPGEWLRIARNEGATHALVVPTMLARLIESGADLDVPTLRSLAYGGARMPRAVLERALAVWRDVDFVNAYGLTETSSTIAVLGPHDHRAAFESEDPKLRARLSSAGRVVPGVELKIADADGNAVPPGRAGRILVRGPQISAEYAGSGRALDEDGWFDTRDEGHVDDDGYLFIGGRVDDTIIRGAENIAPAEIEDVLLDHPAVTDAAVVGLPDEEWGQRIEAAIVARSGCTIEEGELRAFVRERLRSSKTPDRVVVVSELPRTQTGKLVRREVVERLRATV